MTHVLNRLRRITRNEVSWRARAAARIAADRITVHVRPRGWQRHDIRAVLAADVLDAQLDQTMTAGRWDAVHNLLEQRIRGRQSLFVLDPASVPALRDEVVRRDPAAAARAAERADAILEGRYDLLGFRSLTLTGNNGRMDWHHDPVHHARAPLRFWADVPYLDPAIGDHKIIWELNRHQHWLALGRALWLTGDARYGQRMIDELDDWLAANPPLMGINWASMLELGFRSMSWIWGLHFLLGATAPRTPAPRTTAPGSPWLVDMFVALDRQLTHIERNLSIYFSPNTHLTGEALALYVAGVALPELAGSRRWHDIGRRILLEEIDRQILPDGGHAERSTHYHRYTLDFYLMALLTARRNRDADAERRFTDACRRLAEFARAIADANGRLPLIGDDDGGMLWPLAGRECADVRDSLDVAAVLLEQPALAPWGPQEETCWILGPAVRPCEGAAVPGSEDAALRGATTASRLFPDTGYVVMRDSDGSHAVFDVGEHGYMNGGHAHADALSLNVSLEGRPFLVDPGTSTYTMDPGLRDRFRSSASHNTLAVDSQSQARPSGPFHWRTRANATLHGWRSHPRIDWAEAVHDAYAPLLHRRSVLRTTDSGWLIVDEMLGSGEHTAAAHWHFDPDWSLRKDEPGRMRATHTDGTEAWILPDAGEIFLAHGDDVSGMGWFAPAYGVVVPAWTARVIRTEHAPITMVTWMGAMPPGTSRSPSIERLTADRHPGAAIAARVTSGDRTSVFLVRPGSPPSPHICEAGGYETDARVLHCMEAGRLLRLDLIDAMHASIPGGGGLTIKASESVARLHLSIDDGVLDLQTAHVPARLHVQGGAVDRIVSIHLNHRELPLAAMKHGDTVIVGAASWSAPVRDLLPSIA